MILKGSQRGNAAKLARHLMNIQDNEHVELHELRGFVSEEQLLDALLEAQAVAKGTRCQQHLFSLSLNPPEGERVDVGSFETAIEMVEQRLGLDGHPRAIVFHEKEGRRHAHAVWSRIDAETMTAKNLPFFKRRLAERGVAASSSALSRFFQRHGLPLRHARLLLQAQVDPAR